MRSSSTRRLLFSASRLSCSTYRLPIRSPIRNGYCSSCEVAEPATSPETKAKVVVKPPAALADHRQLAVQQGLFTTSIYSPGSPLFLPHGARIFNKLISFLRAQYTYFGFEEVITPTIYKKSLWEKSGHWDNYAEDMFSVTGRGAEGHRDGRVVGGDEEYGLKPMNCPGHCLLFASRKRSYRELPIRYADFSPLHRNEISGALSGLTRVRRFHQDDGHIFCRPSQVSEEISRTLAFVRLTYETFNLGPYRLALSTRPKDHYIGTEEEWNNAETALQRALDASGQIWSISEGEGAFYGPKIDIILKDSDGKEHQTATIQLDFQLPKRFELEYQAPAPEQEQKGETTTDVHLLAQSGSVRPVMIHRAILGSVERFMALLIEHYNGRWPFWLSSRQVAILTVTNVPKTLEYANNAIDVLQGGLKYRPFRSDDGIYSSSVIRAQEMYRSTFAIDLDDSSETLKSKISKAKRMGYGVVIVIGDKNVRHGNSVTVDFSAIRDLQGLISHKLDILRGSEGCEVQLDRVNMEPAQLRELLLALEYAYV